MSYAVKPRKLTLQLTEWFTSMFSIGNIGCAGCASVVIAAALLAWAAKVALIAQDSEIGRWLTNFAAAGFIVYLALTFVLYVFRKNGSSRAEALSRTTEAAAILKGVKEHSAYLAYKAGTAGESLKKAAFELQEEAFAPFWDAVESAASDLGDCHTSCAWLSANVKRYDEILVGREHSFPDCFTGIEGLPDCRPLLAELYRLIRQAQRDFRFSNIWEHRQTRKVLIAGFSTLGEAIRNLENTVARSMADLRMAVEERSGPATAAGIGGRVVLKFFVPFL